MIQEVGGRVSALLLPTIASAPDISIQDHVAGKAFTDGQLDAVRYRSACRVLLQCSAACRIG